VRDGQSVARTRNVKVAAGREIRVDFSDLATAATAGTVASRD
jgi:hypothetical protein